MRNLKKILTILVMLVSVVGIAPAFADDWEATRLRGHVYALENDNWVQLSRGDIVSDARFIRTAPNGRVVFERGEESIELGPDTTIQIQDRTGAQFTTVQQHAGEVTIIASIEDVEHFSVQTPFLAAVVKGTIFKVDLSDHDAEVVVVRGRVNVRDTAHGDYVSITQGQRAVGSKEFTLTAMGNGVEPVRHANGSVVQPSEVIENVGTHSTGSDDSSDDSADSDNAGSSSTHPATPANRNANATSNSGGNGNSGGNNGSGNGNSGGNSGGNNGNSGGNNGNGNGNGGGNNGNGNGNNGNGGGNNGNGNGNGGGNNGNGNGNNGNGGGNNGNGNGNSGGNNGKGNGGGNNGNGNGNGRGNK